MAGRIEEYKADAVIMEEGVREDRMFLVLEGSVVLYMNYGKENEYVLGVRSKGKIFGEMSMLAEEESEYTAVAFTDAKLAWFQMSNIDQFLFGYPGCAVDFLKNIAKNNSMMRGSMKMLLEELSEIKGEPVDKHEIKKEVAKLSAREIRDFLNDSDDKAFKNHKSLH